MPPAEMVKVSGILPPEYNRRAVEPWSQWEVEMDDVMVRRTHWHYYHRDAADKAERVADCQPAQKTAPSPRILRPNDQPVHSVV